MASKRSSSLSRPQAVITQRPAARPGFSFDGSRRRLDHSANRRNIDRFSAKSLISTVPDDTRGAHRVFKQVRPMFNRFSPVLAARATARTQSFPKLLGQVISGVQLTRRALNCAGRQIRKEVLFAQRLTGRGSRAARRRRSENSKEKCK